MRRHTEDEAMGKAVRRAIDDGKSQGGTLRVMRKATEGH